MRIEVFAKHQSALVERPAHYTKRWLAELVVTGGHARKLRPNDPKSPIQLTTDISWFQLKHDYRLSLRPSVPSSRPQTSARLPIFDRTRYKSTLPPRELPNVYFQPPQSASWKEQHGAAQFVLQFGERRSVLNYLESVRAEIQLELRALGCWTMETECAGVLLRQDATTAVAAHGWRDSAAAVS